MRVGVFGGTFDPIHVGHLVAAVNVRHALSLDTLLLVVANVPWQKEFSRAITSAEDRYAMVEAAVGDVPGLVASRIEIDQGGRSYTADTLKVVAAQYPGAELFTVIGADVDISSWERSEEITALSTLVVVNRPGVPRRAQLPAELVEIPALEVSSTDVRQRVVDGRPLDYLVPEGAIRCIRARNLYADAPDDVDPSRT